MVLYIKGNGNKNRNFKVLTGAIVNLVTGYEYYDREGNFCLTKKKSNVYHNNISIDEIYPNIVSVYINSKEFTKLEITKEVDLMIHGKHNSMKDLPCLYKNILYASNHVIVEDKNSAPFLPKVYVMLINKCPNEFNYIYKCKNNYCHNATLTSLCSIIYTSINYNIFKHPHWYKCMDYPDLSDFNINSIIECKPILISPIFGINNEIYYYYCKLDIINSARNIPYRANYCEGVQCSIKKWKNVKPCRRNKKLSIEEQLKYLNLLIPRIDNYSDYSYEQQEQDEPQDSLVGITNCFFTDVPLYDDIYVLEFDTCEILVHPLFMHNYATRNYYNSLICIGAKYYRTKHPNSIYHIINNMPISDNRKFILKSLARGMKDDKGTALLSIDNKVKGVKQITYNMLVNICIGEATHNDLFIIGQ